MPPIGQLMLLQPAVKGIETNCLITMKKNKS